MKNRRKQRVCRRSDRMHIDRVRFFPQRIGVVVVFTSTLSNGCRHGHRNYNRPAVRRISGEKRQACSTAQKLFVARRVCNISYAAISP